MFTSRLARPVAVPVALLVAGAVLIATPAFAAPSSASPQGAGISAKATHGHKISFPIRGTSRNAGRSTAARTSAALGSGQLAYGGGIDSIGVTIAAPRVYLVFWGTQWGTESTGLDGYQHFSGDSVGMAPILQALFKGLGTSNETWSGVMTQYCEGVAVGATSCPANALHVGYPTGGALAGVWFDNSAAAPSNAIDHQIGVEALNAATHFGNTTAASNRNVQYVVISPTGTHPGGFNAPLQWCAWHDYNGDTTLNGGAIASPYGDFAFTNLPYLTDVGASCGANYVNSTSAGSLDGITIVEGHEYAETITDQNPAGGWTDSIGYENGDKCAWVGVGPNGAGNVSFGSFGTFPMQSTYSNDSASCLLSHPVVTNGSTNTVTVNSPGAQSSVAGVPISAVANSAIDSNATITSFTWSASGLPSGLSINASSGLITGTPSSVGTFNVKVTAGDGTGATGATSFTWTVTGNTVTVTSPGPQSAQLGTTIAPLTILASDSNSAITSFTWTASGLPAGLSISTSTGIVSGKPTAAGSFTVTVRATDSIGSVGSASFGFVVVGNTVTVTNPGRQSSTYRVATSLSMHAVDSNGAITTFTWSASNLPRGLSINSATGLISGTPTSRTSGRTVTVTARDSTGARGTTSFVWSVA